MTNPADQKVVKFAAGANTEASNEDEQAYSPEILRGLKKHAPDYLTKTADEREVQRAIWATTGTSKIKDDIIAEMLGKSREEVAQLEADGVEIFTDEQVATINTLMQEIEGIGEDSFSWNEFLYDDETALSHRTIEEYDRASHFHQQKIIGEMEADYTPEPYRGSLYGEWARYLQDGRIKYALISDLSGFISGKLEEAQIDILQELVPHKYVNGPNHGRCAKNGYRVMDFQLDADGKEDLYDAIHAISQTVLINRAKAISDAAWESKNSSAWVFSAEEWPQQESPDQDGVYIIFASPKAMARVRPTHFRADCEEIACNLTDLKKIVAAEVKNYKAAVKKYFKDIQAGGKTTQLDDILKSKR